MRSSATYESPPVENESGIPISESRKEQGGKTDGDLGRGITKSMVSKGSYQKSRKSSKKSDHKAPKSLGADDRVKHVRENCYDKAFQYKAQKCSKVPIIWQEGKYLRDDCGSGIVATGSNVKNSRLLWCRTPLSMYQATIGELGRQVLCKEKNLVKEVVAGPPCNLCCETMPLCRGYYRKYECIKPCEEHLSVMKMGQKTYRSAIQRYWDPCMNAEVQTMMDINSYAHHNVALGIRMRRKIDEQPCW